MPIKKLLSGVLTKTRGSFAKGGAFGPATRKAVGQTMAQQFITKSLGPAAGQAVGSFFESEEKAKKKKNGEAEKEKIRGAFKKTKKPGLTVT